jgi:hypothetical protein
MDSDEGLKWMPKSERKVAVKTETKPSETFLHFIMQTGGANFIRTRRDRQEFINEYTCTLVTVNRHRLLLLSRRTNSNEHGTVHCAKLASKRATIFTFNH